MNVNDLVQAVVHSYHIRQPLMVWGAPGLGKSAAVKQAADLIHKQGKKAEGPFRLIDLRLSLLDPVELRGLPFPDKDVVKWLRPQFLPTSGRGIVFLDEIVQAPPSMQAAASQWILDRRLGEHPLPPGWSFVAAGNLVSHRASANAMPTHIANRFVHVNVEADITAWVSWALNAGIDLRVIAFLKFRSALLHSFDPQSKSMAFPSPRSWEFVSNLLSRQDLPRGLLETMVSGTVGEGAGAEFSGFLRVCDKLPSIDTVLMNPEKAEIPTDPATLYAVTTSLSAQATKGNLANIARYFSRIADAGRPEFSISAMKEISLRDSGELAKTRAFITWASDHNHLIA